MSAIYSTFKMFGNLPSMARTFCERHNCFFYRTENQIISGWGGYITDSQNFFFGYEKFPNMCFYCAHYLECAKYSFYSLKKYSKYINNISKNWLVNFFWCLVFNLVFSVRCFKNWFFIVSYSVFWIVKFSNVLKEGTIEHRLQNTRHINFYYLVWTFTNFWKLNTIISRHLCIIDRLRILITLQRVTLDFSVVVFVFTTLGVSQNRSWILFKRYISFTVIFPLTAWRISDFFPPDSRLLAPQAPAKKIPIGNFFVRLASKFCRQRRQKKLPIGILHWKFWRVASELWCQKKVPVRIFS